MNADYFIPIDSAREAGALDAPTSAPPADRDLPLRAGAFVSFFASVESASAAGTFSGVFPEESGPAVTVERKLFDADEDKDASNLWGSPTKNGSHDHHVRGVEEEEYISPMKTMPAPGLSLGGYMGGSKNHFMPFRLEDKFNEIALATGLPSFEKPVASPLKGLFSSASTCELSNARIEDAPYITGDPATQMSMSPAHPTPSPRQFEPTSPVSAGTTADTGAVDTNPISGTPNLLGSAFGLSTPTSTHHKVFISSSSTGHMADDKTSYFDTIMQGFCESKLSPSSSSPTNHLGTAIGTPGQQLFISKTSNDFDDENEHYLRLVTPERPIATGRTSPTVPKKALPPSRDLKQLQEISPVAGGSGSYLDPASSAPLSTPYAHLGTAPTVSTPTTPSDPAAMNGLINSFAQAGDKDNCVRLLEFMMNDLQMCPDVITMNAVINAHAQAGDKEGAARYLDIMRFDLGIAPDSVTFGAVINAHAQVGDKVGCVRYLEMMMLDYGLRADDICISAVINGHAKAGDKDGAVKYLEMMRRDLMLSPNAITMTTVISAHSKAGDKDGAVKYLQMMIYELGLVPNDVTMNAVINAHAQAGDKDGAVHYLHVMMRDLGLSPDSITLSAVINAHAQLGDKEGAVQYLNMMRDELNLTPTDIAMSAVINGHAQAGDKDGAVYYLTMMIHELGLLPDAITMNEIINAHALSGDKDGAVKYLNFMMHELHLTPDSISMNTVLKAIVTSRSGFVFDELCQQLDIMRSLGIRLDSYSYPVLFMACERKKDKIRCLAWLDELLDNRVELNARSLKIVCDICQRVLGPQLFGEYKARREGDFQTCCSQQRHGNGSGRYNNNGGNSNHHHHNHHHNHNHNNNNNSGFSAGGHYSGGSASKPGNNHNYHRNGNRNSPSTASLSPNSVGGFVFSPSSGPASYFPHSQSSPFQSRPGIISPPQSMVKPNGYSGSNTNGRNMNTKPYYSQPQHQQLQLHQQQHNISISPTQMAMLMSGNGGSPLPLKYNKPSNVSPVIQANVRLPVLPTAGNGGRYSHYNQSVPTPAWA